MGILTQFASTDTATEGGIVGMLGIDWKMLIFQILAFLVTLWVLGKFVYPWLLKSVDERQEKINSGAQAAAEAQEQAQSAEKRIEKLLIKARVEANEIVATAKAESVITLNATEDKSKKLADQITNAAREQIDKDILAAKKALRNEMVELVALATEKVVGKVITGKIDNTIIVDAIKDDK